MIMFDLCLNDITERVKQVSELISLIWGADQSVRAVRSNLVQNSPDMWTENLFHGHFSTFGNHEMVTFLLVPVLAAVIALFIVKYRNGRKLPPGPVGLPLFGYYIFQRKDPVKKMTELAKRYGNVIGLYMGPQYIVVLNDWEAMTEAYGQPTSLYRPPELFSMAPFKAGIGGSNGAEWYHTRRLTSRAMKDIGLNRSDWEELVNEEVLDLVRRIEEECKQPIEVREMFAETFLSNMVTMIVGQRLPPGHPLIRKLIKGVDAILDYSPTFDMVNFSPTLAKLLELLGVERENLLVEKTLEFANFVSSTVDENIKNPPPDFEDSFMGRYLAEIQNSKKDKNSYITVDSLKGNVLAILTGGGETTRSTTIWALIAMAEHPEKQRKVHQELDSVIGKDGSIRWKDKASIPYTLATFFESMRWKTLVPFGTFRMASEDMTVQGYRIPKGTFITINNWAIHNDPRYWQNPEQFVPERFLLEDGKRVNFAPDSFNPFSYGKRNCPGKLIAEMEGLLYFVTLMQKFEVRPKSGQKVQNGTNLGLTYQATNVELRFVPR